ncbi:hypothetical protein [Aminobacter sp. BE322]|uniref:hypothetical protein n=1 Tax=unclassified Aminobacter TaxID=2644704 RepID=UPI003D197497
MQLASILLAIGGDTGNTVPKYDVTPAEVAVLRVIHGDDAVTEIEPISEVARTSRAERQRLIEIYASVQPDGSRRSRAVDMLFPGVAARVFESFDEIDDLDESFFKAETRVGARKAAPDQDVAKASAKPRATRKSKQAEEPAAAQGDAETTASTDDVGEDDGIGDINDGVGGDESVFE